MSRNPLLHLDEHELRRWFKHHEEATILSTLRDLHRLARDGGRTSEQYDKAIVELAELGLEEHGKRQMVDRVLKELKKR